MSFTRSPRATIATEITPVTMLRIPVDRTMVASALRSFFAKRDKSAPTSSNRPLHSSTPSRENTAISMATVPAVPVMDEMIRPSTENPPGNATRSLT